ncbi:hypothetical protein [Gemmatimonas sp.]|uniref:hypothetical protein n=1 Tax=Gemmatimonas sp. TaxID=1962908 RepID=UPI003F71320E
MFRIAVCVVLLLSAPVVAQSRQPLSSIKSFRCHFTVSVTGGLDAVPPKPKVARETLELIFDSIDHKRRTARLISNQGAEDISAHLADDAIFLLESTLSGHLQVTAIYEPRGQDGLYKAVHSRHTSMMDHPLPSQFYGSCRPLLSR